MIYYLDIGRFESESSYEAFWAKLKVKSLKWKFWWGLLGRWQSFASFTLSTLSTPARRSSSSLTCRGWSSVSQTFLSLRLFIWAGFHLSWFSPNYFGFQVRRRRSVQGPHASPGAWGPTSHLSPGRGWEKSYFQKKKKHHLRFFLNFVWDDQDFIKKSFEVSIQHLHSQLFFSTWLVVEGYFLKIGFFPCPSFQVLQFRICWTILNLWCMGSCGARLRDLNFLWIWHLASALHQSLRRWGCNQILQSSG